jgi:hypothetical protein
MQFVGYKNGSPVPGATLNAVTPSGTGISNTLIVTFTNNTAFNDVDEITLAPNSATCNSILFFEEITIGTATAACTTPTLTLSGNTNVLCNGGSTGSATMSASGGSGFTYTWFPSGGNSATASGLSSGIYTLSTKNSCGSISSKTVQITQPPAVVTSTALTNVLCNGGSTGSATVTASGGTGAYTYLWSTGGTTSVITGQTSGVKTVTVTDANNCTSTKSVNINQPSALNTSTALTNVLCNGGNNGSATVTASGGTGAYSYLWSTGGTTSVITSQTSGVKTVTVTDANSCTSTKTVNINQPAALVTSTAVTNILCNGQNNGSATVTASGGTGSYTYLWSTAATTSVITGQTSGVKTVTVTDANNCTSTKSVSITQPAAISITPSQTNITCVNPLGTASVLVSGGSGGFTYTWSPSGGNAATAAGLTAGIYSCTTKDLNNCTAMTSVTITANITAPGVAISGTAQICNGQNAALTASGASSYTWNTGATTAAINPAPSSTTNYTVTGTNAANGCTASVVHALTVNSNPTITVSNGTICPGGSYTINPAGASTYTYSGGTNVVSPSSTTSYSVTGTSSVGCQSANTAVAVITVTNSLVVSISGTNTICNGEPLNLSASGASSYTWNTGATTATVVLTPTANTTYSVLGASGTCSNIAQISLTVNPLPNVTAGSSPTLICTGQSATLNANGALTYSWTPAIPLNSIVSPTTTTSYAVTGADINGCSLTVTITVNVSACTGIDANSKIAFGNLSIYPNPSGGLFNINVDVKTHVELFDITGRKILISEVGAGTLVLDIKDHPAGIYLLNVSQNGKSKMIKLVKE